jgi:hypothetical protein
MTEEHKDDMQLPAGRTCGDCASFNTCKVLFGRAPSNTRCDWAPSRFMIKIGVEQVTLTTTTEAVTKGERGALLPRIHGVSRVADNPCALMLFLMREPSDDDLRRIHDALRRASSSQAPADDGADGRISVSLTHGQVSALYLTLLRRERPAFGWMEEPLVAIEAALQPAHNAIHDRGFNAMNRRFFGDDRFKFEEGVIPTEVAPASTAADSNTLPRESEGAAFTPDQLATLYVALGHFKSSGSVKCADSIMSIIKMSRGDK